MATHKLNDAKIGKALKTPKLYGDGGGLWLQVKKAGNASWLYRFTSPTAKRVRDMGLGAYPIITLKAAREAARQAAQQVQAGIDPLEMRKTQEASKDEPAIKTFAEAAKAYIEKFEHTWSNPKHRQQWRNTLRDYAYSIIGQMSVADISKHDVVRVLEPIWITKPETASRLRQRIEKIIGWCMAQGYRSDGMNPAAWKDNLEHLLGKQDRKVRHHPAMPYEKVPAFFAKLSENKSLRSLALQFLILTAVRTNEALAAKWDEINFEKQLWIVPPERMKKRKEHHVPLSDAAIQVLHAVVDECRHDDEWVFPGQSEDEQGGITNTAVRGVLDKTWDGAEEVCVHGFRSSFEDWAMDGDKAPDHVIEAALAHALGKVKRAYRRGHGLESRRKLMDAWAEYCCSHQRQNVQKKPRYALKSRHAG
jgi:integrase